MTNNKLVIRRLPPSMNEDEFLQQIEPLAEHNYFCFFEAPPGLGCHSFSRAYINFLDANDMQIFCERFDNHIFLDKHGREYPAVVEKSLWHKIATSGPFHRKHNNDTVDTPSGTGDEGSAKHETAIGLEHDREYLEFVEGLQNRKQKPRHSPIQTIENNLDELTHASTSSSPSVSSGKQKVTTPLLDYVNQVRIMKNSRRAK